MSSVEQIEQEHLGTSQEPALSFWERNWHRICLGAIVFLSAVLDFWHLDQNGYANSYYASGVKSMLTSWHAFFFVSFDPGGFVSIDKPPLGFWLQAISAKLFGFSGWSLLFPEALAGVLSVGLLYFLVSRIFGPKAALLAAFMLAITPISVVTNRNNTIDSILTLTTLLAAWAISRATETGKLRWLLLCAGLVGLGFNIKMAEAYLVVPAFGLMYLLGVSHHWWKRIIHLLLALVLLVIVSFSWVVVVDMTPASQRPYVGSTKTNSALELALGYNGIGRVRVAALTPNNNVPHSHHAHTPPAPSLPKQVLHQLATGSLDTPVLLLSPQLDQQIVWFLPLALIGLIAAFLYYRIGIPLTIPQQALMMWGIWLLTMGGFFSISKLAHSYYVVMFAPAICALSGIGLVVLWRAYRQQDWLGWLLPVGIVMVAVVQAYIIAPYGQLKFWLIPLVAFLCLSAAIVLGITRLVKSMRYRPPTYVALSVALVAILIAPMYWTAIALTHDGNTGSPQASIAPDDTIPLIFAKLIKTNSSKNNTEPSLADKKLEEYLLTHQGGARFLVATVNTGQAAPIILHTGKAAMAMGGFLGSDPILTIQKLSDLVAQGDVRFFLLQKKDLKQLSPLVRRKLERESGKNTDMLGLTNWIDVHCHKVPKEQWQTSGGHSQDQLYSCGTVG